MHDWRRAAARRALIPAAIAVAGIVIVLVAGSEVVRIIGAGVLGLAATIAVALAFLEVGYSEDRARDAERARRNPTGR
jgi:threonine dehydrogenase-like Zn-dependent dehydrogenase